MTLRELLRGTWRFLTFREFRPAPGTLHLWLLWGLACTWLAGIGRYWDHPRALWWQSLGLGSLAYVLVLSLMLWLLLLPLRTQVGRYPQILLFVTLTAPPAFLYAIPVERWLPMAQAAAVNAWFLGIVAIWRVALWAHFLVKAARLPNGAVLCVVLLPLTIIVTALASLNLEHVVFAIMSGIRDEQRSAADASYTIVLLLTYLSLLSLPFVLLGYLFYAVKAFRERGLQESAPDDDPPRRR
ncbi:MAG: hypothetical protein AB7E72_05745 [Lysobacterales bacterium]